MTFRTNRTSKTVEHLEHNQGSALIIAVVVITVISTIGFAVGRLMVSEVRQTSQIEDSMMAYYAAESGIEQGLLMWRYNQDIELPDENMSEDDTNTMRVNLDTMQTTTGNLDTPPTQEGDKTVPYFDLRIWYKNDIVDGVSKEVVCSADADSEDCQDEDLPKIETGELPALAKDNFVQYDVSGLNQIEIKWDFVNLCIGLECDKYILEFIPIDDEGNLLGELKTTYDYSDRNKGIKIPDFGDLPENIDISRFRIYGNDLKQYSITVNQLENPEQKMSSRYTYIESTGYYGSAKRRLQIKIDRYTGTVLGPYDLVIFQGQ